MFPNSGFYFLLLFILVLTGFWPSYFSKLFENIDHYTHFHALTMLLWVFMLIAQAFLVRFKQYSLHKAIGKFSYGLVPALIVSLILLAHSQIEVRESGISSSRLYLLYLQLSLLAIFVIAYSLAIINRASPAHHARYMICTALTLIDPAVARIPLDLPEFPFSYQVFTFAITDIPLILLIFLERKQKIAREVFPIMLMVFLFFQILNLTQTDNDIWVAFANWFANLPLT